MSPRPGKFVRIVALILLISVVFACCACAHWANHSCDDPAQCPICCFLRLMRLQLLLAAICGGLLFHLQGTACRGLSRLPGAGVLTLVSLRVQMND